MKNNDVRKNDPWVKIDPTTWDIIEVGSFDTINQLQTKGHLMTLYNYNQLIMEL